MLELRCSLRVTIFGTMDSGGQKQWKQRCPTELRQPFVLGLALPGDTPLGHVSSDLLPGILECFYSTLKTISFSCHVVVVLLFYR